MNDRLPDRLAERTRALTDHATAAGPVIYWMRTAVRAHENPALDVAITMANELGVPVFVYHALSERYRYASDRHHRFILEGARDVANELAARGIATAFHLERPGHRGPHLKTLTDQASALVTEEMPVYPLRNWTRNLADSTNTPVFCVDTACVVPMRSVGRGITRAFQYRKRIAPLLDSHLEPWEPVHPNATAIPDLPFTPIDLGTADLDALIASCQIDHTVPPVADTVGGSIAGYERWNAFREGRGLKDYAKTRNSPVNRNGVSRMSAYLHYGMVSPFRLAREARDLSEKYVDELIVWRELAYTWCLFTRDHESLSVLPEWAQQTLAAHASDPREFVPTSEALHAGRTGSAAWDLAQTSLLRFGELHNNIRMTWGKAILNWSRTPALALERLIDLNHRYALDGRDPGSYGGLLWCMGLFDRPFPEQPIWGTVRSRSVARHARRIDMARWGGRLYTPRETKVAVVGAGLCGSFAARTLIDHRVDVTLFDKGRGAGGRLSSKRHDGPVRIIHGAPQLHVSDPRLSRYLQGWLEQGAIQSIDDGVVTASPPNALIKHLQRHQRVRFSSRVRAIRPTTSGVIVSTEEEELAFDAVILTAPAPQAQEILGAHALASELDSVTYEPCWVGLFTFDAPVTPAEHPSIAQCVGDGTVWAVHATAAFSEAHLEDEPDTMAERLATLAGFHTAASGRAHRWRYAKVREGLDGEFRAHGPILLAGDLFAGGKANGALLSGAAAAGHLLRNCT